MGNSRQKELDQEVKAIAGLRKKIEKSRSAHQRTIGATWMIVGIGMLLFSVVSVMVLLAGWPVVAHLKLMGWSFAFVSFVCFFKGAAVFNGVSSRLLGISRLEEELDRKKQRIVALEEAAAIETAAGANTGQETTRASSRRL